MPIQYPSLSNLPIEKPPGYFDPTIIAWKKVADTWDGSEWQSKALAAIGAVGAVFVMALNTITMTAKLLGVSRLNNALDEELRSLIDGVDALKYKDKRLKYDALSKLISSERNKIVEMIFQGNDAKGTSTPFQLAASKSIIFSEISDFLQMPDAFWPDFLKDIYDTHGALVENGINEIDETLNDPEKLEPHFKAYMLNIQENVLPKYQQLMLKKGQREQQLEDFKQQYAPNDNSTNTNVQNPDIKDRIDRLEKEISRISREMDRLISKDDLKVLETRSIFGNKYRNKYFTKVVKQKLLQRRTFLESIKQQKNLYVPYVEEPTSWFKTAVIGLSVIGAAAAGYYVYNNGLASSFDDLSNAASSVYLKAGAFASYTWNSVPSVESVKAKAARIWESATWDNTTEKAQEIWNGATVENARLFASRTKEKAHDAFESLQEWFKTHGYDFGFDTAQNATNSTAV